MKDKQFYLMNELRKMKKKINKQNCVIKKNANKKEKDE